ncbi:MAG TPA: adenylyl-sulfate kinase [Polyangiaceae bacterium]
MCYFSTVNGNGFTVWLTGLPCSGKSTVARNLARRFLRRGRRVEVLDGDLVRQSLSHGLGFSREDRDRNIQRVAFVANLLARNDVIVIVAIVSPYRAARDQARRTLQRFFEVHVDCPISECERRDVKGMYKRARAGELRGFTGVDDPYEIPLNPDFVISTHLQSSDESAANVESALVESKLLSALDPDLGNTPEVEQRYSQLFVWPESPQK